MRFPSLRVPYLGNSIIVGGGLRDDKVGAGFPVHVNLAAHAFRPPDVLAQGVRLSYLHHRHPKFHS